MPNPKRPVIENVCEWKCKKCDKSFSKERYLKCHFQTVHEKRKPYACNLCPSRFANSGNLANHIRSHTGEKRFKCEICHRPFLTKHLQRKHEETHNIVEKEKMVKCPKCEKVFKCKTYMERHVRYVHAKDAIFECNVCQKTFTNRENLTTHMQIHSTERSYKCRICGRGLTSSSNRAAHERTHAPKKHKCSICSKMFHYRQHLRRHAKIHQGERFYVCLFCPKAFMENGVLWAHVRTHLNERPFICEYCKKEYRSQNGRDDHIRKFHS